MSKSQPTNTGSKGSIESESNQHLPISGVVAQSETNPAPPIDPQVKAPQKYKQRRTYSSAYKERILSAFAACTNAAERGKLLRSEGLYHSRIIAWRQQAKAKGCSGKENRKQRNEHLTRENVQLKKKLAQAEAIIDLQKKVSELLGDHILPIESNEIRL